MRFVGPRPSITPLASISRSSHASTPSPVGVTASTCPTTSRDSLHVPLGRQREARRTRRWGDGRSPRPQAHGPGVRARSDLFPLSRSRIHVGYPGAGSPGVSEERRAHHGNGTVERWCHPAVGAARRPDAQSDLVHPSGLIAEPPAGAERMQPLVRVRSMPDDDRAVVIEHALPDGGVVELRGFGGLQGMSTDDGPPRDARCCIVVHVAQRAHRQGITETDCLLVAFEADESCAHGIGCRWSACQVQEGLVRGRERHDDNPSPGLRVGAARQEG